MTHLLILINLAYFFLGINGVIGGVNLLEIAGSFKVEPYVIGYLATFMSVGSTGAVFFTGFFARRLQVNQVLIAALILLILCYVGIAMGGSLFSFGLAMLGCGAGTGIFLFIANYVIITFYKNESRTVHLNFINFSYSAGAVVAPIAAGLLLKYDFSWEQLYLLTAGYIFFLLLLALPIKRLVTNSGEPKTNSELKENWNINVYIIGFVFICYALAEVIFSNWIIVYLREFLAVDIVQAGGVLSLFWAFMTLGRLAAGFVARYIRVDYYIAGSATLAFLSYLTVLLLENIYLIMVAASLMGLFFSGLYASLVSYGTMQYQQASSKLVNFYISISSVGSIVCFLLSSAVNQYFGVYSNLLLSAGAMGMVALLITVTMFITSSKKQDVQAG